MIKVLFANTHYPDRYNLWAPWNKLANIAVSRSVPSSRRSLRPGRIRCR